jgi:hypothetical protein
VVQASPPLLPLVVATEQVLDQILLVGQAVLVVECTDQRSQLVSPELGLPDHRNRVSTAVTTTRRAVLNVLLAAAAVHLRQVVLLRALTINLAPVVLVVQFQLLVQALCMAVAVAAPAMSQ